MEIRNKTGDRIDPKTNRIGHPFLWKKEIDSTNEELKRLAVQGAVHGTVFCADRQTKGKGRRGRSWDSPSGENIYLSILLRPEMDPGQAPMLTLMCAVSAAQALETTTGTVCRIKWPNDLVWQNRKVCGILTEMSTGTEGIRYVIVGIGININRDFFPEEIASMAGSVQAGQGKMAIIEEFLSQFEKNYKLFEKEKTCRPFLKEYNQRLVNIGKQVQILSEGEKKIRISYGIDEGGALIVADEYGKKEKIISGEVSVRGLYGYV